MKNSTVLSNDYGLKQFQFRQKNLKISNSKSTPPPHLCLLMMFCTVLPEIKAPLPNRFSLATFPRSSDLSKRASPVKIQAYMYGMNNTQHILPCRLFSADAKSKIDGESPSPLSYP